MRRFKAILWKEAASELRTRTGLFASALFAVLATTAIGFSSIHESPTPTMAAALLWVVLAFAAVTGLTRAFVLEEDQKTADLLRLWSSPEPIFWGKLTYNFLLLVFLAAIVVPLHIMFTGVEVRHPGLLMTALATGCVALSSGVTFCGALISRSSSRGAVAGVICLPVLLPVILAGMGALRVSFGDLAEGAARTGWTSVASLVALSAAFLGIGRQLFAFIWEE